MLDLRSCSIGDACIKSLMRSISRCVDQHSTVYTHVNMDLRYNEIREEGVSHIAEILDNAALMSALFIDSNLIGEQGLQTIFNTLGKNNSLIVLSITNCGMTDTGVTLLAQAMTVNTTLKTLYIDGNSAITDKGLTCLVEALSNKSVLSTLVIPRHLKVVEMWRTINETRKRYGLEGIQVECEYTLT